MKTITRCLTLGLSFALVTSASFAQQADIDDSGKMACAAISTNLRYGMKDSSDASVSILQDFLHVHGYLQVQPTGFFGRATFNAVKSLQTEHGIPSTGFVGPITRAKIQSLDCTGQDMSSISKSSKCISPNDTACKDMISVDPITLPVSSARAVDLAKNKLAIKLGVSTSSIVLLEVENVTSGGCLKVSTPGMYCAPSSTESSFEVTLRYQDYKYLYRVSVKGEVTEQ